MATGHEIDNEMDNSNLETFALLWLDPAVHTSEENRVAQQQLRSTINYVTTFEEPNSCQQYIHSVHPEDRLVLIVWTEKEMKNGPEILPKYYLPSKFLFFIVFSS